MTDLQHIQSDEIAKLAIVGRPNVGKSTLFNRLLGRRRAIIAATPGVTRDPISQAVNINGERCILIDTGGLSESREYLNSLIVEKIFSIIRDADIILLLLDITGITPEDEQLIEHLRPFSDHILIAINKVDNEQRLQLMSDYYGLGFSQLFPISAAHGIGCEELSDVLAERIQSINKTYNKTQPLPPDSSLEEECADENSAAQQEMSITILGQPNTGKSTLSNFLSKGEHSIVTPTAGTTRDVLKQHCVYNGHHFSLLDTAGIRRKKKVHDDLEYYSVNRAIAAIEESQIIFLMIDAEKNLSDQDKKIAFQAVKHGRGVIIVLNKWDLIEKLPN
ncbi:MAG: ribosome biogenesis GTPase Der, partial [Salinispira sp.]